MNDLPDGRRWPFRLSQPPQAAAADSKTGYLNHFADMEEVEAAASPPDFARDAALAMLRSRCKSKPEDRGQLSLF